MPATDHSVIRDDLRLTSWILLGACLQSLLYFLLPPKVALLPAVVLLLSRVLRVLLMLVGGLPDHTQDQVVRGRNTVKFPQEHPNAASSDELAVFILGARFNHPLSRLAPAVKTAKDHFDAIWREAEDNQKNNGYLGRAADLMGTDEQAGNAIITISYWKSKQHLYEFAKTPAHLAGWQWFEEASKKHKHLSFFHETYYLPKNGWESIYRNTVPWGLAQTKYLVTEFENGGVEKQKLVSGLVPAIGVSWKKNGSTMQLVT